MLDGAAVLTLLRLGDSGFPAGGFAFSWGIEGLMLDGLVQDGGDLDEVVADHLDRRWNTMDRPLLCRGFAAETLDDIAALDRLAETATPCDTMRDGSRRAGRALLGTAARLATPMAGAYREAADRDPELGHLPVVQAVFFRSAGLSLEAAQLLSGWTLVSGLVAAAARLGLVGHVRAQHSLTAGSRQLAALLTEPARPHDAVCSFTPLTDISVARKRTRHTSMFTT